MTAKHNLKACDTLDLELAWTTEVPFFIHLGYAVHWVF